MVDKWPKPKESAVLSEEYGETFCYGLLILPGGFLTFWKTQHTDYETDQFRYGCFDILPSNIFRDLNL